MGIMSEPTVQMPVSLAEDALQAAEEAGWDYTADRLRVLIEQHPKPTEQGHRLGRVHGGMRWCLDRGCNWGRPARRDES